MKIHLLKKAIPHNTRGILLRLAIHMSFHCYLQESYVQFLHKAARNPNNIQSERPIFIIFRRGNPIETRRRAKA